jgi:hypothetical protein
MWSLISPRAKRISGPGKFGPSPQKDFCNNICHNQTHAPQQTTELFDYFVGGGEQVRRYRETERLGCSAVDHQLKLRGLQNRQISWFGTFENLPM